MAASARWWLFGGKGGVGKSTCAAAFALRLAAADPSRRVLLLSSDPAHSLGDVLGQRIGDRPVPVAGAAANLRVREIDAAASLAAFRSQYLDSVDEAFARMTRGIDAAADHAAFKQIIDLAPPGIDEVIAVTDVSELIDAAPPHAPTIVSDTAPTGHALRLLQTPAVLRGWTQALMAILLKYREIVGAGELAALLVQLSKRLRRLEAVLLDPAQTRFVVVTRAAALPREETIRFARALAAMQVAIGGVIVNATGAGTCSRCRTIAGAQDGEVGRLIGELTAADRPARGRDRRAMRTTPRTEAKDSYAIIEAPAEVPPPHGAAALTAWTASWRHIT
jgi:arsenite-transporting ATPase